MNKALKLSVKDVKTSLISGEWQNNGPPRGSSSIHPHLPTIPGKSEQIFWFCHLSAETDDLIQNRLDIQQVSVPDS